jgi:3-deoxy-D-manno-octulosonate 8-phosphate phosphatase (KDO 8-P phosphatase)
MTRKTTSKTTQSRARAIKLAVFDVDGVLTDGTLHFTESGEEVKVFHALDGHGLTMLKRSGVELALITGRSSRAVERRAQELGIAHLYQGSADKLATYTGLLEMLGVQTSETSYMGDDVMDIPILRRCGLAATVPDAPEIVQQCCTYVARRGGGKGAVRELCELIMHAQGTLSEQLQDYLR